MNGERALRVATIVLAVVGVWDPSIAVKRVVSPRVAVVATADVDRRIGPREPASALAREVAETLRQALGPEIDVVERPVSDAAHYVFVGETWPLDFVVPAAARASSSSPTRASPAVARSCCTHSPCIRPWWGARCPWPRRFVGRGKATP